MHSSGGREEELALSSLKEKCSLEAFQENGC
jgi:hypothetical protein